MRIIKFIFKFVKKNHEAIIRYLIKTYLPGYHLHRDQGKKIKAV